MRIQGIDISDGIDEGDTSSSVNRHCIHVTPSYHHHIASTFFSVLLAILFPFVLFYLSSFLPYAAPFTIDHGVDSDVIL